MFISHWVRFIENSQTLLSNKTRICSIKGLKFSSCVLACLHDVLLLLTCGTSKSIISQTFLSVLLHECLDQTLISQPHLGWRWLICNSFSQWIWVSMCVPVCMTCFYSRGNGRPKTSLTSSLALCENASLAQKLSGSLIEWPKHIFVSTLNVCYYCCINVSFGSTMLWHRISVRVVACSWSVNATEP